jgi:hypothetical protein
MPQCTSTVGCHCEVALGVEIPTNKDRQQSGFDAKSSHGIHNSYTALCDSLFSCFLEALLAAILMPDMDHL